MLTWWTLGATIAVERRQDWRLGLSAVLEETDGSQVLLGAGASARRSPISTTLIASPRKLRLEQPP